MQEFTLIKTKRKIKLIKFNENCKVYLIFLKKNKKNQYYRITD